MLVALMGIPCTGKSTLAASIASAATGIAYVEPGESAWPQVVQDTSMFGQFECLLWFRGLRVPMYIEAAHHARAGQFCVIDSVWDKLYVYFMEDPSMHWILAPDSPYLGAARALAEADSHCLPNPDVIVFLSVRERSWRNLLHRRARRYDAAVGIGDHFDMQEVMRSAVENYCKTNHVRLITFEQDWRDPGVTAGGILNQIMTSPTNRRP